MAHRTHLAKFAVTLGAAGAIALAGCGDKITCAGVGLVRVRPADTTIRVGQSFVARYEEGGTCTPGGEVTEPFRVIPVVWRTVDTLVVTLDPTGRVTGVGTGDAQIFPGGTSLAVVVHVR